jgi:hypothetical protein
MPGPPGYGLHRLSIGAPWDRSCRTDVLSIYDRPDEDIREEITGNVIVRGFLEDPPQFAVTLQAGVVTVQGSPETAALGHDIVRKIRHVPGVVAVDDQLSYPVVAGSASLSKQLF